MSVASGVRLVRPWRPRLRPRRLLVHALLLVGGFFWVYPFLWAVGSSLKSQAGFIDEDLLFYRRHLNNASRTKSLVRQFQTRIELLLAHARYGVRSTQRQTASLGRQTER